MPKAQAVSQTQSRQEMPETPSPQEMPETQSPQEMRETPSRQEVPQAETLSFKVRAPRRKYLRTSLAN